MELLPIKLGELHDQGVDLKLIGFSQRELAEYLGQFNTDLEDGPAGPEEPGETIRRPTYGLEFAPR